MLGIGLGMIEHSNKKRFLVFEITLSCIQALSNQNTSNSLFTQVLKDLNTFVSIGFHIVFCWIPGHVCIMGNEKVDGGGKAP